MVDIDALFVPTASSNKKNAPKSIGARVINKKAAHRVAVLTCANANCRAAIALGEGFCFCHVLKLVEGLVKAKPVRCSSCFDPTTCLCPDIHPDTFARCPTCLCSFELEFSACDVFCDKHGDEACVCEKCRRWRTEQNKKARAKGAKRKKDKLQADPHPKPKKRRKVDKEALDNSDGGDEKEEKDETIGDATPAAANGSQDKQVLREAREALRCVIESIETGVKILKQV